MTAAGMGCDARIVTSHGPDWVGAAPVSMTVRPASATTTFAHEYASGRRRSRLLAVAAPLDEPVDADVVFCCPVAGEIASPLRGPLVGAGLQGWLRQVGPGGEVRPRPLPPLAGAHVWFASSEDLAEPPDLPGIVVWTEGAAGARVRIDGRWHHVRPYPTVAVDPTGAGDVFAAAFLVALARGEPPVAAAEVAACAASIVVEDIGTRALARLHELPGRLARYRPLPR